MIFMERPDKESLTTPEGCDDNKGKAEGNKETGE